MTVTVTGDRDDTITRVAGGVGAADAEGFAGGVRSTAAARRRPRAAEPTTRAHVPAPHPLRFRLRAAGEGGGCVLLLGAGHLVSV